MSEIKLIDQTGEYFTNGFKAGDVEWRLVGTSSQVNHKNPMLCIDTFKSDKGELIEVQRQRIFEKFIDKKITALPWLNQGINITAEKPINNKL